MPSATYDHIAALGIMGVLFAASVVALPTISYINLLNVDQQQLRNVALEVLKTMLFDTGYPSNWGSTRNFNKDGVERFGLALSGVSSFYVLDSDKVQRLVADNPSGSLDYETVRTKLGLRGYSFTIRIVSPFNVTVRRDMSTGYNPLRFNILTTFNDGRRIPNARVEATIVYVVGSNKTDYFMTKAESRTNERGECTIEKVLPSNVKGLIVVMKTTVADMATVSSHFLEGFKQNVAAASIVGDNMTMWIREENMPGGSDTSGVRWIMDIISVKEGGAENLYEGGQTDENKITYGRGYYLWSRVFSGLSYDAPLFFIFSLSVPLGAGEGGRQLVLFAGPNPNWLGSRLLGYGSNSESSAERIKLSRSVEIRGMTYIFELLLWKES